MKTKVNQTEMQEWNVSFLRKWVDCGVTESGKELVFEYVFALLVHWPKSFESHFEDCCNCNHVVCGVWSFPILSFFSLFQLIQFFSESYLENFSIVLSVHKFIKKHTFIWHLGSVITSKVVRLPHFVSNRKREFLTTSRTNNVLP